MSAIEFVLLLLNIVMHNIGLFECQLVLLNYLELTWHCTSGIYQHLYLSSKQIIWLQYPALFSNSVAEVQN